MAKKMPKFVKTLLVLGVIAAAGYGVLFQIFPYASFRYKIMVTVETPDGIKTGSAVRELTAAAGLKITPESHNHAETRGEAVVVDLGGDRGLLFALRDTNDDWPVLAALNLDLTPEGIHRMRSLRPGAAPVSLLAIKQPPMLVRFKDLNDPKSVQAVYPDQLEGAYTNRPDFISFMKAYGSSVKLKDISIEITDEPVTTGLVRTLPWLANIKGYLHGGSTSRNAPLGLDTSRFKREF